MFNDVTKCSKISRVYITFKIESSRSISDLKHDNNTHMENIFDKLLKIIPSSVITNSNLTKDIHKDSL